MLIILSIILLLAISTGLGFALLARRMQPARHSVFHLTSIALLTGMPVTSLMLVLLGLVRLPVAWWILTPIAAYGWWKAVPLFKNRPVWSHEDRVFTVSWLVALGVFILMLHGSLQYPWLEDGDPWEHALTAEYVHDTRSILKPDGMYIAHYLPPYPPGMAVLEGAFWLGGSIILWLKVLISLVIALMYPAFALLLKRLKLPDEVIIPSVIIAAMLPGVTHFIYAQQVALLFTLIALAWLPPAVRKGFWLPFAISAAAVLVTQQITSVFLITSSILLYAFLLWEGAWKQGLARQREEEREEEKRRAERGKDEEDGRGVREEDEKGKEEREGEGSEAEGKGEKERTHGETEGDKTRGRRNDEGNGEDDGEAQRERKENAKGKSGGEGFEEEKEQGKEQLERKEEKGNASRSARASHDAPLRKAASRMNEEAQKGMGGERVRMVQPFMRLLFITLAFTLTIILLAGSFYAVMFKGYGKQGVFGTYGISEENKDSVWYHYIHPPEKRCPSSLVGVDPSCAHPYYTFKDFWRTSSANSIDAGKGLGQAVVLYTLLGILISLGLARKKQWQHPTVFLLAWLILTLLGVYGDALPVAFLPHRWWAFLTWPVAGIAGIGIAWLSTSLSTLFPNSQRVFWTIMLILLLPVWMMSMQAKIGLNTAVWPPHGYPTVYEYASWLQTRQPVGYLALTLTAPRSIKEMRMADLCSNTHSLLAGSGMRVPTTAPPVPAYTHNPRQEYYMWDIKNSQGKAWQLNMSNLSEKLKAYAAAYNVDAFTLGTSCVRFADAQNTTFETTVNTLLQDLVNAQWRLAWQAPGVLVLQPPPS